jgi:DNA ligase-1
LGPQYEGKELGVGDAILMKAIMNATGANEKALRSDMEKYGDMGLVAQAS